MVLSVCCAILTSKILGILEFGLMMFALYWMICQNHHLHLYMWCFLIPGQRPVMPKGGSSVPPFWTSWHSVLSLGAVCVLPAITLLQNLGCWLRFYVIPHSAGQPNQLRIGVYVLLTGHSHDTWWRVSMKDVHPAGLTSNATSWQPSLAFFLCYVYNNRNPDVKIRWAKSPPFLLQFFSMKMRNL